MSDSPRAILASRTELSLGWVSLFVPNEYQSNTAIKKIAVYRNASVWIELLLVVCVYATDHRIQAMGATYSHLTHTYGNKHLDC